MGRTYNNVSKNFDNLNSSNSSEKSAKHVNGRKTGGMRTINNYVEEDYDLNNETFNDDVELDDKIQIKHTKHKP